MKIAIFGCGFVGGTVANLRINKFLSEVGYCSRRKADVLILDEAHLFDDIMSDLVCRQS